MPQPENAVDLARHPLTAWTGPLDLPDFTKVSAQDFSAVFDAALSDHRREIDLIATNFDSATVENTLAALELAGDALDRVSAIFWCIAGAHTNDAIQAIERETAPKMARHASAISLDARLFARIDALYQDRDRLALDAETLRVLEQTWKGFVRAGARLGEADKKRLAAINEELASLGASFGQNVLADEKAWALFLDETDLAGLPQFLQDAMAEAAEMRGQAGPLRRHSVALDLRALHAPSPSAAICARRPSAPSPHAARMAAPTDNRDGGCADTLALRAEKAGLLGYASYAALKLDDTMAKTPEAVFGSARSGVATGARQGCRGPGRIAAARRRGRQQPSDRGLGLALLRRRSCGPRNSPSTRLSSSRICSSTVSSPPASMLRLGCSA